MLAFNHGELFNSAAEEFARRTGRTDAERIVAILRNVQRIVCADIDPSADVESSGPYGNRRNIGDWIGYYKYMIGIHVLQRFVRQDRSKLVFEGMGGTSLYYYYHSDVTNPNKELKVMMDQSDVLWISGFWNDYCRCDYEEKRGVFGSMCPKVAMVLYGNRGVRTEEIGDILQYHPRANFIEFDYQSFGFTYIALYRYYKMM
jgi:hypothetical protein